MVHGNGKIVAEPLDLVARWLTSISAAEVKLLKHTREYREFIKAAERLESAHKQIVQWNNNSNTSNNVLNHISDENTNSVMTTTKYRSSESFIDIVNFPGSFLQQVVVDDILLRICGYLECRDLVHMSLTCTRFCELANKNAKERCTRSMISCRQLSSTMELLRAQEQLEGIGITIQDTSVPIPTLLLRRRVIVTQCGDPEFLGIYYCTGNNGNGFVFTKPRNPEQRPENIDNDNDNGDDNNYDLSETDSIRPGHLLRCIIAKRFSNETILWYMSKEIVATEDNGDIDAGEVIQVFSFWAKLMVIGDAAPDICRYPSQTSILTRSDANNGWQNLSTTRNIVPPVVELLD